MARVLGCGRDLVAGGRVLFASSVCAFYTASAMMWKSAFGRLLVPLGHPSKEGQHPGSRVHAPGELLELQDVHVNGHGPGTANRDGPDRLDGEIGVAEG